MIWRFEQVKEKLQYLINEIFQIAEEYDSTKTYAVDDYCTYEGKILRCTSATSGAFDSSAWTDAVIVMDVIKAIKARLTAAESNISTAQSDISAAQSDISAAQEDITALNLSLAKLIKRTSFSGTPSAAGNFSHAFGRNVFVLAAGASVADTVVIPYPSTAGYSTWWFNCHASGVSFPPYTSGSLTVTVSYIEI